jgi:hypothetical protein
MFKINKFELLTVLFLGKATGTVPSGFIIEKSAAKA